jgi:hypothetical protein
MSDVAGAACDDMDFSKRRLEVVGTGSSISTLGRNRGKEPHSDVVVLDVEGGLIGTT